MTSLIPADLATFGDLLEATDAENEDKLGNILTHVVDPLGVTGSAVRVCQQANGWELRVGQMATHIVFPTSGACVEEALAALFRDEAERKSPRRDAAAVIEDRTVLEAVSWRLAATLVSRHPAALRVLRTHPSGGQADCLTLVGLGESRPPIFQLNRVGEIQACGHLDGQYIEDLVRWPWRDYLAQDSERFILELETSSGLVASEHAAPTDAALTYRVLAALAATQFKADRRLTVEPGYIDTSGYGAGPNEKAFAAFPWIEASLLRPRDTDPFGEARYRFWFLSRSGIPLLAFEQESGQVWNTYDRRPIRLRELYRRTEHDEDLTAARLLARALKAGVRARAEAQRAGRGRFDAGDHAADPHHYLRWSPGPFTLLLVTQVRSSGDVDVTEVTDRRRSWSRVNPDYLVKVEQKPSAAY